MDNEQNQDDVQSVHEPVKQKPPFYNDPLSAELCKTIEDRARERNNKRRVHMQPLATAVADKSNTSWDGSKLWPRIQQNDPIPSTYHPCTPYHAPNYDEHVHEEPTNTFVMSPHHKQQQLKMMLGNRRFDGEQKGDKSLPIDEYIEILKRYRKAVKATDAEVLTHQSMYLSGKAMNWWLTHEFDIHTIGELEARLRSRFGTTYMGRMQRIAQFTGRKQKEGENLLDYMDDKRALARKLEQPLTEATIIEDVVNNALWKYRCHLAARKYTSLNELNRHMEYLSQGEAEQSSSRTNKQVPKSSFGHRSNRAVNATTAEMIQDENESVAGDDSERDTAESNRLMDAFVEFVQQYNRSQSKRPNAWSQTKPKVASVETKADEKAVDVVNCYGCNAPGVIQRNCPKCNANKEASKNGQVVQ